MMDKSRGEGERRWGEIVELSEEEEGKEVPSGIGG
jgi:hypothetical protein